MEGFWRTVSLGAKILLALFVLRALIAFSGSDVAIPLLDPLYFAVRDSLVAIGQWGARISGVKFGS